MDVVGRGRVGREDLIDLRARDLPSLEAVGDLPGEVYVILEPGGAVSYVSPEVEHTLGYTPEEYRAAADGFGLVHPDDRADAIRNWALALGHPGELGRHELRMRHGDGGWRWMEGIAVNKIDDPEVHGIVVRYRDITDRKALEALLRANEQRFRALVQHSSDGTMLLDRDAVIVDVSESVATVVGWEQHELIGTNGYDLVHPDDLALVADTRAEVERATATSVRVEVRVKHASGGWRWVDSTITSLVDHPDVQATVVNFHDVTERRRAEAARAASEERFRALVTHSPLVTTIVGPAGEVTWVSPSVTDLLGYEPQDLLERGGFDLVHPDDLRTAGRAFRDVFEGGAPIPELTIRFRHQSGAWRWLEITGADLTRDPAVRGVMLNLRDVTDRVEATNRLESERERFHSLLANSRIVTLLADAEAGIVWASPAALTVLGYEPDALIGRYSYDFIHPDDHAELVRHHGMVLDQVPERPPLRIRGRHADGGWRWLDCTAENLLDDPDVNAILVNLRDVSPQVEAEEARRATEVRARALVQNSADAIIISDADWVIQWASPAVERMLGVSTDDVVRNPSADWVHPDDREVMAEHRAAVLADPSVPHTYVVRLRNRDGEWRWVEATTTNLLDDPDVRGIVSNGRDITDRVRAQHDRDRLTQILEASTDLVLISDFVGHVLYVNEAGVDFFEIDRNDLDGFRLGDRAPSWARHRYRLEAVPALREDGIWSGELAYRKDGSEVPVSALCVVHRDEEDEPAFVSLVLRDISERKAFEQQLEHAATHDPLTDLPNRTLLLDRLDVALRRAQRTRSVVAVLFLDIDHFKVVNDSRGHGTGDELLVALAARLEEALRPGDTVARFGGDEFVVLCEDLIGAADAVRISDRIDAALRDPFPIEGSEAFVTVSIGIALAERDDLDPEALIRDADAAMYQAKERGRNRFEVFDSRMRNRAVDRLDTETALRRAIDRGELRTYYQPKIDLRSGRIVGVEALLRWEHPERGVLDPAEFIDLAEDTGLIVDIGAWVLGETFRQVMHWEETIDPVDGLFACVNLSGKQLTDPDLVAHLTATLRETGIDPSHVDLEMTESVLIKDVEACQKTLRELKELGVLIVIDDFGTGYSSLSYLQQFPVDLLKIDRSFVTNMDAREGDYAIVQAVISLAHALDLQVIAEGVETPAQLAELRSLGCDFAQGYLMARPQPEAEITALLAADPRF